MTIRNTAVMIWTCMLVVMITSIKLSQRSNNNISDHGMDINIYSDNNSVHIMQEQNVDKNITLTINNDDNDVSIHQRKSHGHTATVTLSGSYGTNLDLQQGTNNTTQGLSYSLSQNCQTVGGCSVSVSPRMIES